MKKKRRPSNLSLLLAGAFVLAGEVAMFWFIVMLGLSDPSTWWKLFAAGLATHLIFQIKRTTTIMYGLFTE